MRKKFTVDEIERAALIYENWAHIAFLQKGDCVDMWVFLFCAAFCRTGG